MAEDRRPFDAKAALALIAVDETWRDKKWTAFQWMAAVVTFRDLLREAIAEIQVLRTALVEARRLNNRMADALGSEELSQLGMDLHDVIDEAIGRAEPAGGGDRG